MNISRREVRVKVMQTLYAQQLSGEAIDKVKQDLLSEITNEDYMKFAGELISKVLEHTKELDDLIHRKLENWEPERVALIDKIILRMGVAELLFFPEIPPKVSINEAIDIAKNFCTRNSGKFVNGILDAVLKELKDSGKLNKSGRGLVDSEKKGGDSNRDKK